MLIKIVIQVDRWADEFLKAKGNSAVYLGGQGQGRDIMCNADKRQCNSRHDERISSFRRTMSLIVYTYCFMSSVLCPLQVELWLGTQRRANICAVVCPCQEIIIMVINGLIFWNHGN